jgi:hypothetical protein
MPQRDGCKEPRGPLQRVCTIEKCSYQSGSPPTYLPDLLLLLVQTIQPWTMGLWWCVLAVMVAFGSPHVHATLEGGKYDPGLTMVPLRHALLVRRSGRPSCRQLPQRRTLRWPHIKPIAAGLAPQLSHLLVEGALEGTQFRGWRSTPSF